MNLRIALVSILMLLALSFTLFRLFQGQVAGVWMGLAVHPEIRTLLRESGDDLKHLAELDPAARDDYRERFERIQEARRNLEVLAHNSTNLTDRYEQFLLAGFSTVVILAVLAGLWSRRRTDRRLARLRHSLESLAAGEEIARAPFSGTDLFGRISRMIEKSSSVMAAQRRKLRYLDHLAQWQETARRLGHELRTPLATMRLELERLQNSAGNPTQAVALQADRTAKSVLEEIDRLKKFVQGFISFARVGRPKPAPVDLVEFLGHFGELFVNAWPNVRLKVETGVPYIRVSLDRGMIRQVLMNLCNNAAKAAADKEISIEILCHSNGGVPTVDVRDTGTGIEPGLQQRLFEPYVTTREYGSGMGLGLAISRKIMLEHGGDLELVSSSEEGTCFRMSFAVPQEGLAEENQ